MSANLIERLRDQRLLEAHRTTAADTVAERTSAGYREQLLFDAINALAAKDTALSEMAERVHYAEGTAIANIARANEAEAALSEMRAELDAALKLADWSAIQNNTVVNEVWDILGGPDATREGGQSLVVRVKEMRAELERARAEIKRLKTPDSYWDWSDPEYGYCDISEALSDAPMGGVVRLMAGKTLDDIWVTTRVLTVDENGEWDDHEVATFDNPVDAEKCWGESLATARALASHDDGEER